MSTYDEDGAIRADRVVVGDRRPGRRFPGADPGISGINATYLPPQHRTRYPPGFAACSPRSASFAIWRSPRTLSGGVEMNGSSWLERYRAAPERLRAKLVEPFIVHAPDNVERAAPDRERNWPTAGRAAGESWRNRFGEREYGRVIPEMPDQRRKSGVGAAGRHPDAIGADCTVLRQYVDIFPG